MKDPDFPVTYLLQCYEAVGREKWGGDSTIRRIFHTLVDYNILRVEHPPVEDHPTRDNIPVWTWHEDGIEKVLNNREEPVQDTVPEEEKVYQELPDDAWAET